MATVKQGLFVVVWEWENKQRRWRPYTPEVTQLLERAYSKNLRSVFLGDSDPALKNYCVHLPEMEQECKASGETVKIRRFFYAQSSPAGQGAVWQWAGDVAGDWHVYDMCVQCIIEESWGSGAQIVDLSHSFRLCPYVINFCNLTQMNSRTGFIRCIRRIQQAAYPVGRRPVTPQQSQLGPGHVTAESSNSFNNINSVPTMQPVASVSGAKPRRRGSRGDDADSSTSDAKPRTLMNMVFGRSNGNSSKGGTVNQPHNDGGDGQLAGDHKTGRDDASPPKPLPRIFLPPKPKPRTNPPPKHSQLQPTIDQPQFFNEQHYSQRQQLIDDQEDPRMLRNESAMGRFGSNHTLDSDCSSINSGRRPSVDTTSTYLSLESVTVDDELSQNSRYHSPVELGTCSPVVDRLVQVDSDENMDDDVFSEDQEVQAVMRGAGSHSSPSRAPSPLTLSHSHHHSRQMSNHHSVPFLAAQSQSHFMPINAPQPGSDLGLQVNGIKRKYNVWNSSPGHLHKASSGDGHNDNIMQDTHFRNHHSDYKPQHRSRAPIAAEDQLLVQHTNVVLSPPDEMCSICMSSLQEPSGYFDDNEAVGAASRMAGLGSDGVVRLILCDHLFHLACVREMAKNSPQYLECPNCKTLHGEKHGNQPNGHMNINIISRPLPGYHNCSTIQITYNISSGIQGPEHPRPGRPYHAIGFPRTAYLPNNDKGKKVLKLLQEAWRRRLVFTIGTSVTLGIQDAVTWNEIHHKTEWNNAGGHGYPDPNYLDNTLKELALHGVTETTLV
ncbi:probable E3 ubiquitin-protein ligase DTX2 isoform X2 [Procambarus clarkii]|uniref:probable E3 ubiquitin-protein ligase DTX2 isoform X2 n=1 Tax=Procambarus clarkii TaxID=6728 RepID=UPI0037439544